MIIQLLAVLVVAYLLGSFPTGLVVSKLTRNVDVRDYGSGKTGATNVLRTAGAKAAALVLVGDIVKGALAVLLARYLLDSLWIEAAAGFVVIVGHNWPITLRFRGGRGVNTTLGGVLVLSPLAGIVCGLFSVLIMAITRYVSLGSILGALSLSLFMLLLMLYGRAPLPYFFFSLGATSLVLFQHRDNIDRLLRGKERKLGQEAETKKEDR